MNYFDWTIKDVLDVIENSRKEGKDTISLDMEHCTYRNEVNIFNFLKGEGYTVELGSERIHIKGLLKQEKEGV